MQKKERRDILHRGKREPASRKKVRAAREHGEKLRQGKKKPRALGGLTGTERPGKLWRSTKGERGPREGLCASASALKNSGRSWVRAVVSRFGRGEERECYTATI